MLSASALKTWSWWHKWSSLVCTAFMLLLCLTGLPLIFHHEIDHLTGGEIEAPEMPADTPRASLDTVLASARALYPDRIVQFASQPEDDDRLWHVTLTPTPAPTQDFKSIFPLELFGLHVTVYAALLALIANLAVAAVLTVVLRAAGVGEGHDDTVADDYEELEDVGGLEPLPAQPGEERERERAESGRFRLGDGERGEGEREAPAPGTPEQQRTPRAP